MQAGVTPTCEILQVSSLATTAASCSMPRLAKKLLSINSAFHEGNHDPYPTP